MSATIKTPHQPLPLSVWRLRARRRERRTEYLARAYACGDMALRALDADDAQLLRAMTIVWQILADKGPGAHSGADVGALNVSGRISPCPKE
jgi:hypothetical protein